MKEYGYKSEVLFRGVEWPSCRVDPSVTHVPVKGYNTGAVRLASLGYEGVSYKV